MKGDLLLGIDIGTYGSKGVVCHPDGTILAQREIEHGLDIPAPGWAEQDADAIWWADFVALCRLLLPEVGGGERIGGVGCSAIGPCLLPVDGEGRPLRRGILYGIDTRAQAEIEALNAQFGEDALLALGGMRLTSQAIGPKLLWLRNHEPDVFERAQCFITASSYLVLRLTGELVIDYHTGSSFNPLVDLRNLRWDGRFAGPIVDLARLPCLGWATEVAGHVTTRAAAETGLAAGTPVSMGTVDAAAEALSVGVVDPGDLMLMYGTTMFFILVTKEVQADPRMWATAYCLPGKFDMAAGMSTTGALTRWFRDEFARDLLAAQAMGGDNTYAALTREAGTTPPGAGGLVVLPYFSGERTPIHDPEARGIISGLTLGHSRGHLYRALLEATGYGVRHNLEVMRGVGAGIRRAVAVGGGARNDLWLQAVSDITGVEQEVPSQTVGAAYGDAFLAGLATGLVPSLSSLRRDWVKPGRTILPNPANAALYDDLYAVYRALYAATKAEMHSLAAVGRRI